MKKKAVLICPHKPSNDPRIDWVANTLSKYYDVTVVGVDSAIDNELKEFNRIYHTITIPVSKKAKIIKGLVKQVLWPVRRNKRNKKNNKSSQQNENVQVQSMQKSWQWKLKQLLSWWWFFISIHMTFMDYLSKCDMNFSVIVCVDLLTLKIGSKIKIKNGIKMLYDAHEFLAFAYPNCSKLQILALYNHEKKYIRFSDAAFTVNKYMARVMEKKLSYAPIYAVPNAAPLEEFKNYYTDDIEKYAKGRVKFLFQGCFEEGRGLECLIKAWTKLENTNAALFLRGPDNSYKDYLYQIAQKYGVLGESVFFLPSVGEQDLIAAARNADVGIIPYVGDILNNKYACPNKLSQYMQAGVAILANNLVFVKSRLDKYKNGLIYDSERMSTLIEAVQNICSDSEQLELFKKNSLKYAMSDYNWEVQSREMDKVLAKISK